MTKKKIDFKKLTPLRLGDEVLRIQRRYTYRFRIRRKIRRFLVKLRRMRRRLVRPLTNLFVMDREDLVIHREDLVIQRRTPHSKIIPPCIRRILTRLIKRG